MTKIKNYDNDESVDSTDRLFGTNQLGKNKNYEIGAIVALVNSIAGKDYIQYKFSPSDYGSVGSFTSNASNTNPSLITKLFFNKKSASKEDLTALFTKIDTLPNIVIELRNPSDSNNFATFKITNITNQTDYFELDVVVYKSFFSGLFTSGTAYSAYFDVKENFDDKLNQGNYTGTAETLKTDIETRVVKVAGSSLVPDAEIIKLSHLDDTTDLQKPVSTAQAAANATKLPHGGYAGTAQDLESHIFSITTGFLGTVTPTDTPTGSGRNYWEAIVPGTYSDFGGVVLPANNRGLIYRDETGAFSISYAALDLTEYSKKIDIFNTTFPTEIAIPDWTNGFYVDKNTGALSPNESFRYKDIVVDENTLVKFSIYDVATADIVAIVSFYDEADVFISAPYSYTGSSLTITNELLTIPSNATKVRFCNTIYNDSYLSIGIVSSKYAAVEDLEDYALITDLVNYTKTEDLVVYAKNTDIYNTFFPPEVANIDWVNGFYVDKDTGALSPNASYRYKELEIDETSLLKFSVYAVPAASIVAVVAFYDIANVFISAPYTYDTNPKTITNELIDIPINAKKVRFCILIYNDFYYSIGVKYPMINSVLKDKNGLWVGTSIPAGVDARKYPEQIGARLSMLNTYNQCIGSSGIRRGKEDFGAFSTSYAPIWVANSYVSSADGTLVSDSDYKYAEYPCDESIVLSFSANSTIGSTAVSLVAAYDVSGTFISSIYSSTVAPLTHTDQLITLPVGTRKLRFCTLNTDTYTIKLKDIYGWLGGHWYGVGTSLSTTIAERYNYINNYNFYKPFLIEAIPDISAFEAGFINASYENRLVTPEVPDFFFFNHGFNDIDAGTSIDYSIIPPDSRDRNTFIGASNFIIDRVLEINPNVRILFIGHYQGDDAKSINIRTALTTLSQYWSAPFYDLSKKLNWCNQPITVAGSWVDGVWIPGADNTMSLKDYYIPDAVHPSTDISGKAINLITESLIYELRNL